MNPRPRHYEERGAQAELALSSYKDAPECAEARPKRSERSANDGAKDFSRDVVLSALDTAFESVPVGSVLTAETLRGSLSFSIREQLQVPTRKNLLGAYFRALRKANRGAARRVAGSPADRRETPSPATMATGRLSPPPPPSNLLPKTARR